MTVVPSMKERELNEKGSKGRLAFQHVTKQYENGFVAVKDLSFTVHDGEFLCILGKSGCGKTTCLHLAAGFEFPTSGAVLAKGDPVSGPGPDRAMIFQSPALLPWMSVYKNVILGPKCRHEPQYAELADSLLEEVGLSRFANAFPYQLSGGMRQRVAIVRALIGQPEVLIMDEPFGALDAQTRLGMQEMLLSIWERRKTTIMFVTHDVDEALFLADRVLIMSPHPGRVREALVVDLPRPRDYRLFADQRFVNLKRQVMEILHEKI
jgi:NitT/TauT family transport system ATP-binding protein